MQSQLSSGTGPPLGVEDLTLTTHPLLAGLRSKRTGAAAPRGCSSGSGSQPGRGLPRACPAAAMGAERREGSAGDFGQHQPFLHCVKLNKQGQGGGSGNCLSRDGLRVRAWWTPPAGAVPGCVPRWEKGLSVCPLSWVPARRSGDGERTQTNRGGSRGEAAALGACASVFKEKRKSQLLSACCTGSPCYSPPG